MPQLTDRATFDFRTWLARLQLHGSAQDQIGTVAAITGISAGTVRNWYYGHRTPPRMQRALLEGVARGREATLEAHCHKGGKKR